MANERITIVAFEAAATQIVSILSARVALSTLDIFATQTLPAIHITIGRLGAERIAVARRTASDREAEVSRRALVAAAASDARLTDALAADRVASCIYAAARITFASLAANAARYVAKARLKKKLMF